MPTHQTHQYPPPVYTSSPQHVSMNLPAGSPPPPSPHMYDPLSPPISGSDTSADGLYHHHSRNSSGTGSPSSSRGPSLVHRQSLRYNPTPSPTTSSSGRRGRARSLNDSDDEDNMGATYVENLAHTRKEATRRQRIEAEQRRRDELRDGYAKLKDVLPVSNQKSSKVSLLERGKAISDNLRHQMVDVVAFSYKSHHLARQTDTRDAGSSHGAGAGGTTPSCRQRENLAWHWQLPFARKYPWRRYPTIVASP